MDYIIASAERYHRAVIAIGVLLTERQRNEKKLSIQKSADIGKINLITGMNGTSWATYCRADVAIDSLVITGLFFESKLALLTSGTVY